MLKDISDCSAECDSEANACMCAGFSSNIACPDSRNRMGAVACDLELVSARKKQTEAAWVSMSHHATLYESKLLSEIDSFRESDGCHTTDT